MNLNRDHMLYWRARKSPAPQWFGQIAGHDDNTVPKIDALINGHAGIRETDGRRQAVNTLMILRSARKRGALMELLERMASNPHTVVNPKRRAGYCRKWLKRIQHEARKLELAIEQPSAPSRRMTF